MHRGWQYFLQAPQMLQRAAALETGAAFDTEIMHVSLAGQRRRESRRRGAVDAVHVGTNCGCNMQQTRVVADSLPGDAQQIY